MPSISFLQQARGLEPFQGLSQMDKKIWTYREALVPDIMPKSLLVVGSGAIGIEFASFFNALGAKVTVVEMMDRVMPVEDEEISKLARKAFDKAGYDHTHQCQSQRSESW